LKKEDGQSWEDNGIVYVDKQIYTPNNRKIQEQVLQENHNPMDIEHPEQQRVLELLVARHKRRHQEICSRMY